jgi:integrase
VTGGSVNALGSQIAAFVGFKRVMGWKYVEGEAVLRRFATYCAEKGFESLTEPACKGFVQRIDPALGSALRHSVSYLRAFARWARLHGDPGAYTLPGHWAPRYVRPETYLLADSEVAAFFGAAASFDHAAPWPWQAKAFFGLMLACGLRPCEARRLERGDVDCAARTVFVRDSKGPRSRLLPITGEVADMLAACDESNSRRWPRRESFFAVRQAKPVSGWTVCDVFRLVWNSAGLPRPAEPPFPRPYSFRHHFACANLERWAAAGVDPAAMLPYLSRYMGHASVESTLYYLHVSPGLISGYEQLAGATASLLPEVGFDA